MFNQQKKALSKAIFKHKWTKQFGAAKVDTKLKNDTITPGGNLESVVELTCEKGFKEVEKIIVSIRQQFRLSDDEIHNLPIYSLEMSVPAGEKDSKHLILPFSFVVPYYVPYSLRGLKCWIQTDVNLPYKLDPRDIDFIEVEKPTVVQKINDVLVNDLGLLKTNREEVIYYSGFNSKWVINEWILKHPLYPMLSKRELPVAVESEYLPSGEFKTKYREIELIYDIHDDRVDVYVELQFPVRKEIGGYFERAAIRERGQDEVIHKLSFTNEELDNPAIVSNKFHHLFQSAEIPEVLK